MSPRLPRITATQPVRVLRGAGWGEDHQTGPHLFLRHPSRSGTVVVPIHARKIIKPKVLEGILDQAGLSAGELRDQL